MFSEKYWYGEELQIHSGLGVLKRGVFVHYSSEEFNTTEKDYEAFVKNTQPLAPLKLEEREWLELKI